MVDQKDGKNMGLADIMELSINQLWNLPTHGLLLREVTCFLNCSSHLKCTAFCYLQLKAPKPIQLP